MTISTTDLHGRIVDCDSHLMPTGDMYRTFLVDDFGKTLADWMQGRADAAAAEVDKILTEPDPDRVWTTKWWHAFGANDPVDRIAALDLMGIDRQVMFPTILVNLYKSKDPAIYDLGRRYCDFVLDWAKPTNGRVRPIVLLNMHDRDEAMRQAEYMLNAGATVCQIDASRAPAGISPADEQWDPFWALFAEARVPLVFHLGSDRGFMDDKFDATPRLRAQDRAGAGEAIGPFNLMTMYMAPEAYLTAMIYGGVFERHPDLRIGVIEMTARWVSGWVDRIDAYADTFARRLSANISEKPSYYVRNNIRVTPFYGEPVGEYIARDGLEDVYVFSTDYPHAEGGTDPIDFWHADLVKNGHSDDVIEKFFIKNGEAILPAYAPATTA